MKQSTGSSLPKAAILTPLSKSKIMGLRQCRKRLWLDVHAPERRLDSEQSLAKFAVGDLVGALARELYDEESNGVLIDVMGLGVEAALAATLQAMDRRVPIFEAGFSGGGARAFVDILLPSRRGQGRTWDLIEVKSSTSPKQNHRDDIAFQAYVLKEAGVPLGRVKLALIDPQFVYRGASDYRGLLKELDFTEEALAREEAVKEWIADGHQTVQMALPPAVPRGLHCKSPYVCHFLDWCRAQDPDPDMPVEWLPHLQGELRRWIVDHGVRDMRDIPAERLTLGQQRIRFSTETGSVFMEEAGLARALQEIEAPISALDFETVQLAVPIWPGARPYQTFPFQWSLHCEEGSRDAFLDLSGEDPSQKFVQTLLAALPATGSVLVWNAAVEKTILEGLARRYPVHAKALRSIVLRIIDLAAIVEAHFYHPLQKGSFRLKRVLPALVPDLDYASLEGVKDGLMALMAYIEAIQEDTSVERKAEIERSLRAYCARDTLALLKIHAALVQGLAPEHRPPASE